MDTYLAGSGAEMVREAEQLGARAREASSTSSRDEGADLVMRGWLVLGQRFRAMFDPSADLMDHEHSASTG